MSDQNYDAGFTFQLYRYTPSIPAAVAFAVLFFMVAFVQFVLIIRRRTYFFIPFFVGLLREQSSQFRTFS